MVRRIIQIEEALCDGCGLCASACHEGAIAMVDGKARLLREDVCDGLGDCLPACPAGAITLEEREVAAPPAPAGGCPGARPRGRDSRAPAPAGERPSRLSQWPVQLKLVAPHAACFDGADLLVAADCTAYAYGDFHEAFLRDRVCLIGCPKLDGVDYTEKLTQILAGHAVRGVTVVRMEVPCCGGLERMVRQALHNSGKGLACRVVTITTDGRQVE